MQRELLIPFDPCNNFYDDGAKESEREKKRSGTKGEKKKEEKSESECVLDIPSTHTTTLRPERKGKSGRGRLAPIDPAAGTQRTVADVC